MADQEIARRLKYVHQTLELIAFLLAVLVAGQGGVGLIVGASATVLLVLNALTRSVGNSSGESVAE